jgi:hypothetical protein
VDWYAIHFPFGENSALALFSLRLNNRKRLLGFPASLNGNAHMS